MFNYDETRTLGTINVPALVICGGSDIATLSQYYAHESGITSSRTRYLQPGGHMGLMEQNLQFAEAVSTFSAACFVTQQVVLQNFSPINFPLIIR